MYFPVDKSLDQDWIGYLLIMPVVAVGNVGQLTVDLLLSSLPVELMGRLHSTAFLPVIGPDPFNASSERLMTSCQVYLCQKLRIIIVQQRSPVAMNQRKGYIASIMKWVMQKKFQQVIFLSSSFKHFHPEDSGVQHSLRYLCTPDLIDSVGRHLNTDLGWKTLEKKTPFTLVRNPDGVLHMPGAGMTRSIFDGCVDAKIPAIMVISLCSEGNNIPDALYLADHLNKWLALMENQENSLQTSGQWKIPVSWNLMFGNSPPNAIY